MTDKVRDFHWHKPDRVNQPDAGIVDFSRNVRDMSVKLFAMTGTHCLTLRLILGTRSVPDDLQEECDAARVKYLDGTDRDPAR